MSEALRGPLAAASACGGAAPPGTSVTWAGFREVLVNTAREAAAKEVSERLGDAGPDATANGGQLVHAIGEELAPPIPEIPGPASTAMGRTVIGIRGFQEIGKMHEVAIFDPLLPEQTWVARCGWAFGSAKHVIYEQGATVTCDDCARARATGGGVFSARAKRRRRHDDASAPEMAGT